MYQAFAFVVASSQKSFGSFCPGQVEFMRSLLRSKTTHLVLVFVDYAKVRKYLLP
jgi:hypothetical protein